MAKKKLIEVWQCDQCEDYYDTKKEAEEDECTDKTITKFYQCDSCEEYYETPYRAEQDDECDGKFNFDPDTLHYIDGKLQRGHMKCLTKGCGWEGSIEDTDDEDLTANNAVTTDAGELLYTTGANDTNDIRLHRCPECSSEALVFVPLTAPVK